VTDQTLDRQASQLAEQIRDSFGARGRTMEERAARAGRALPRHVRRDIDVLSEARALEDNPKLARQVDMTKVDKAYKGASTWLGTVDRSARRKTVVLNTVTEIAFRLFIVAVLFLAVLIWRDLI
jgi:hypothetical protein